MYVDLQILIPNRSLIFTKSIEDFRAEIDITIHINDNYNNKQIIHSSFNEQIIVPFYEDTRLNSNSYNFSKRFLIP